jgi:hypothetical protein
MIFKYAEFIDAMCGRDVTVDILQSYAKESVNISEVSAKLFNGDECTEQHHVNQETVDVEFAQLHSSDVNIAGVSHVVKSLEDSGAQLCVVRCDIIKGTVKLRGIFGAPVQADLIRMQLKLANRPKEKASYVSVICAVCIYEDNQGFVVVDRPRPRLRDDLSTNHGGIINNIRGGEHSAVSFTCCQPAVVRAAVCPRYVLS